VGVGAAVAGLAWYAHRRSLRALPGGTGTAALLPAAGARRSHRWA
jgi:hypothetical protein